MLWAITLAPPAFRAIRERGGFGSITLPGLPQFRSQSRGATLPPITGPVPIVSIGSDGSIIGGPGMYGRGSAAERRRRGFVLLGGLTLASFLMAIVIASPIIWVLQIMVDLAFGAFLVKAFQLGGLPQPGLKTLHKLDRGSGPLAGVSYLPQRGIVEPNFRRSSSF